MQKLGGTMVMHRTIVQDGDNPLMGFSDRACSVALSGHAEFGETPSGARPLAQEKVMTNKTEDHGIGLNLAINGHLSSMEISPSSDKPDDR